MRITVIEDSIETVGMLARALKGTHFSLHAITTEPFFDSQVEAEIGGFHPDLIILDLLLSETLDSGFRILNKLKASPLLHAIPVVVCSKYIKEDEQGRKLRNKAVELGAADVVDKVLLTNRDVILKWLPGISVPAKNTKGVTGPQQT